MIRISWCLSSGQLKFGPEGEVRVQHMDNIIVFLHMNIEKPCIVLYIYIYIYIYTHTLQINSLIYDHSSSEFQSFAETLDIRPL